MRCSVILAALLCAFAVAVNAQSAKTAPSAQPLKSETSEAKELSGMSVLGNNETPKALYIVPWKSSELGAAADLRTGLLNDAMAPVDKDVFMRELQFYQISSNQ
jgi:hypothetical protein